MVIYWPSGDILRIKYILSFVFAQKDKGVSRWKHEADLASPWWKEMAAEMSDQGIKKYGSKEVSLFFFLLLKRHQ